MIFRTFDNQMAQVSSCTSPKGQINACYPTSQELDNYSMLDFDNGITLYELGKASNECTPYPLCYGSSISQKRRMTIGVQ